MEEIETTDVINVDEKQVKNYFPFQTQTQIVNHPTKCPIQKKLEKFKVVNIDSFEKVVELLNVKVKLVSKKSSDNSKNQTKILKAKLEFLEKNKPYIFELARTYLDSRTYHFLEKKNLDFLYHTRGLTHLKNLRGLVRPTSVYFYPNFLHTHYLETQHNGIPISIPQKCKSTSGKLIIAQLRFFFVDIDGAESWMNVNDQILSFGMTPDVIIQTSEKSFHLYWSIKQVDLNTENEDKNGNQLDKNLILYELGLKSLIKVFNADPKRSNSSSLMRVPNTWNIKPHKNKKFMTKYLDSSKSLEDARKIPNFTFENIVNHISKGTNREIFVQSENEFKVRCVSIPELDNCSVPTPNQIQSHIESVQKKIEFDFASGWDESFESLCKYFKITPSYFEPNDVIVLKQMWVYRLTPILNFQDHVRLSLTGSGSKYSELNLSIAKIAKLPRKIGHKNHELIFLAEPYKKPTGEQIGKRNGYKVSSMFLEACGQKERSEKIDWLNRISNRLYSKGNRNNSIPYDCFVLQTILQKNHKEALQFLLDKIDRSANQPDIDLRCSNDTSNVENWLRYYYK